MKIFSVLMLLTLLASCTTQPTETEQKVIDNTSMHDTVMDDTINEMDDAMGDLDNMKMDESKVQLIKYSYANPAQEVNMDILLNFDDAGIITMVDVTSDNWDQLGKFNASIKEVVVGLTLEQASEIELLSGASLTTQAFKEAIKSQL